MTIRCCVFLVNILTFLRRPKISNAITGRYMSGSLKRSLASALNTNFSVPRS